MANISHLLTRPVGRPSHKPKVLYESFWYQAQIWDRPRRVEAKVEWHDGELLPRVGFIVANVTNRSRTVVHFYNYGPQNLWMQYTRWADDPVAKKLFKDMDRATREPDPDRKKTMIQDYIDIVAEQAVLYPVVHNELMTAWNPKRITGIRAQPYPGISLLQAKWA